MIVICLLHLSLYGFILTTHALQHQRVRPNGMAILPCGDLKAGKVTWSRDMKGYQVSILSTDNGEIIRHMNNNNHNLLSDLSLIIWFVSIWDEGLYYCNGTPVACLTVKTADGQNRTDLTECLKGQVHVNVMQQVLMFGGVGLAALMFLFATAAAVKPLCSSVNVKQRAHTTDHVQIQETDLYYINLREQQ
ncbi:uncharacterized protein LOC143701854 [Siphateles boraxobius]|uniref:uncharacterized protein LOC143701854 n=1 Tax=Siphateles boraxobius TaxID=180520 RepID=UPI00406466E2